MTDAPTRLAGGAIRGKPIASPSRGLQVARLAQRGTIAAIDLVAHPDALAALQVRIAGDGG